jgi:SAM-dependent methyltransferase
VNFLISACHSSPIKKDALMLCGWSHYQWPPLWLLLPAGVDVVVADMLDLPFEPESFDLVIEKGTMVHNVHDLVPSCVEVKSAPMHGG